MKSNKGNTSTSYLELLNEQQRDAVVYTDGPSLVIAGAGSGKTRVLTYKIVHLLSQGFEPYRIMALTFTNKAAREMKERIAGVVGERIASRLWMGTFHSIFLRLLRANAELIGYKKDFTIYDTSDSKSLVKTIIKDLALDEKVYKPSTVLATISNAKNRLVDARRYVLDADNMTIDRKMGRPMIGRIFEIYTQRCQIAQAMDFDDILYYMNVLLRDHPEVLRHYQEFFRYILVDEYQDTNLAQHLIVSQLSKLNRSLCVVGDDAQSIYSFRGANISNILSLEKYYPGLKTFKLERNYRSTQTIINAAGSLIKKNKNQIPKNVYSENQVGAPIKVMSTYSDLEESTLIANTIAESKLSNHDSYSDYAILYRTNAQSRILEESLRKRNIPYRIYGGLSFYQRKEVKDAICYFRLALNPDDDEAIKRVINYPARGIGDTTVKKLTAAAIEHRVSLWEVINNPKLYEVNVHSGTINKLNGFADIIHEFIRDNERGANAFELAQLIYNRTGIYSSLEHDNTPESISRKENLNELLAALKEFVDLRLQAGEEELKMADFLSEVSLATDAETEENADEPKVTLMTVHAAKGLEFDNVYIVGVEEDLFPATMSATNPDDIEEERRLLYVAITRAKNVCMITYAGSRYRNGQTTLTRPSRFIRDISPQYVKLISSQNIYSPEQTAWANPMANYNSYNQGAGFGHNYSSRPQFVRDDEMRLRSNSRRRSDAGGMKAGSGASKYSLDELQPGVRICHNRYGEGVITAIDGEDDDAKIIVDFDTVGVKKLMIRIAVFTIIN